MTTQEAFDKVWDWYVVQGNPRGVDTVHGACWFRTPGTKKRCALGCLIPDEVYTPELEGIALWLDRLKEKVHVLQDLSTDFLLSLRRAHDSLNEKTNTMRNALEGVAKEFDLEIPSGSN